MTTITLWLLIFSANGYRPAVVIDRFKEQGLCEAALRSTLEWQGKSYQQGGISDQFPFCLRVDTAR